MKSAPPRATYQGLIANRRSRCADNSLRTYLGSVSSADGFKRTYTDVMYLAMLVALFAFAMWLEWRYRLRLYQTRKERLVITLVFFVIGVAWDSFATIHKTWVYPGNGLIGIWIGVLPIEEYLFSLIVPFWILTSYKLLEKKLRP